MGYRTYYPYANVKHIRLFLKSLTDDDDDVYLGYYVQWKNGFV
jgi:hypothetical protein